MGSVPVAFETTVRVNDKYEARYDLLLRAQLVE
jgi:hypothetical protein